jgi:hypothetical protein
MRRTIPSTCVISVCVLLLWLTGGCSPSSQTKHSADELYTLFSDPPAESRPFVRWWWNGNNIEPAELERELDVMKAAGIGGVEVNPIAHPEGPDIPGYKAYDWLSPGWNERMRFTLEKAKDREMIVDLIMGSGWPFGGEFLKEDQWLQGVGIRKLELEGPARIELSLKEHWRLPGRDFGSYNNPDAPEPSLFFLQMLPQGASGPVEMTNLIDQVDAQGRIEIQVPPGKHDLYLGTFQKAYRNVMHGAPGSRGPVVDHYDEADVRAYMDRLAQALEQTLGGELGDHLRALFCDSIELSGANITDDFFEEFQKRRGYDLEPFVALVYYAPYEGYTDTLNYSPIFEQEIRRMRYDFNKTLVELFLERFTMTFDRWANEHGMLSRYQAYGMPWLVGMIDGYRMVDIPESNNWLYSDNAKAHGYWIWNKYASSGAHLSGARLVGCEAMTNTRGVFRMTLDKVKRNDDFNFITGINHTVLHGYNYSPPEAGFPGWIRYGAYFSEQNSWWPYFRQWSSYNARLSAVFQHSTPVTDVAICTPEADIWRQYGLVRYPYYMNPWYHHDLWEGFSRHGITADYINEGVIQRASAQGTHMISEHGSYQLVIISSAMTMEPETLVAIRDLAAGGVRFLFVEHFPSESPGFYQYKEKDLQVRQLTDSLARMESIDLEEAPVEASRVTDWTGKITHKYKIQSAFRIDRTSEGLYSNKYKHGEMELFFLSNQKEESLEDIPVTLDLKGRTPWRWDPETGKRNILPVNGHGGHGELRISLQPLESMLIVLQEDRTGTGKEMPLPEQFPSQALDLSRDLSRDLGRDLGWDLEFIPTREAAFNMKAEKLFAFGQHPDPRISSFAGQVHYRSQFMLEDDRWDFLDLGRQEHITEVILNGKNLGCRWYGRHLYPVDREQWRKGSNTLEIIYTTTLANYANSLEDNEVAKRWISLEQPEEMGLTGEIRLWQRP